MQHTNTLEGRTIVVKDERIAVLRLTIGARTTCTARLQVVRMVHAQALLAGAGTYTREALQDALGLIGAHLSVSADDGDVDISLETIDTALPRALSILKDVLLEPHFHDAEIARIKTYLTNNLRRAKEDARGRAHDAFASAFLASTDRRASCDIDTLIAELESVTATDVRVFHETLWDYAWQYTIGGSADTVARCEKALARTASARPHTLTPYHAIATTPVERTQVHLIDIPSKQNIELSIGGQFPYTRAHELYPASVFAMQVLGMYGGFVGRLMSIVREKEGLTYGIYARIEETTMTETGVWRIMAFFAPKDAAQGVASTLREVQRLYAKGITEDELARFKVILGTRYALVGDSLRARVAEQHGLAKVGMATEQYTAFKKTMMQLTRREVNTALKTFLDPERIVISGAGPVASVRKELLRFKGA